MTTIAAELLNDFEDSGSENGEEQNDGFVPEGESGDGVYVNGTVKNEVGDMELEDDEEAQEDVDLADGAPSHLKMEAEEDEEETKARVEKMELKGVSDVRSVAGLMKQLEPVIEVSHP
jgi:U4/U6 small nuclear ribonucleoprotein PRP31